MHLLLNLLHRPLQLLQRHLTVLVGVDLVEVFGYPRERFGFVPGKGTVAVRIGFFESGFQSRSRLVRSRYMRSHKDGADTYGTNRNSIDHGHLLERTCSVNQYHHNDYAVSALTQ